MAANVARLTRAKEITLTRAEGLHSEVDKPITLHRQQHPDIWAAADKVLFDWSWTAPKGGGYDKIDFTIVYDDGEKYTGRYDLRHYSDEYPHLAKHVYDFVRFTAGKYKGALTQEEYDRFKEQPHFKKLSPEFLKFLEKYEIGTYNIMGLHPEVKQAEKGWKDFFKGNRIQAMIDSTNYRIGARNVSETEQKRLHESLKTDFKDLVEYQNLQSWGFASGLLTKDEAELLYRIYGGESPSAEKWDNLTLGEKVAATKLADELLSVKLKKTGYSARTLPKLAEDVPFLQTKGLYEGGWKPGDVAIYSDFGLRSLFIVQILPWPAEKPDLFTDDLGVVHNRSLGSVRAKVIDITLVDWDFQRPPRMGKWNEVGTTHYYHFTNLYRDIQNLIAHEARVLKPNVLGKTVSDLKSHAGWEVLKRFGLTGPETLKLGEKMVEVPLGKEVSYITIEDPGKTTFSKGAVVSSAAFAEENERVRNLGEKEATGWSGDKGEWPHKGNGANDEEFQLKSLPDEPIRRPKREDDLKYLADSPEFLANTIEKTGWRERLDKEFQLAIARTRN